MASPRFEESPEPPSLDVHRLESEASGSSSVVMVKLTDEMFAALLLAQKKRLPMKIHIEPQGGGQCELGDASRGGSTFSFQKQAVPGTPTDAVIQDRRTGIYRSIGSFRSKFQVNATEKSFSETRDRAQKLAEVEKTKGTKDLSSKHGIRIGSSASRHPSPLLKPSHNNSNNRPTSKPLSSTGTTNGVSSASSSSNNNNGSNSGRAAPNLQGDLKRKKLRQRVVQLVVTGRFRSWEDVFKQIRHDGLGNDEPLDIDRRVEAIVREISEPSTSSLSGSASGSSSPRLALKSSLYSEVDTRWPWFTQEEKAHVRRLTQNLPGKAIADASSFAPMRKSGVDRMLAPSHVVAPASGGSRTVSPEVIPTPPTSRPSSGNGSGSGGSSGNSGFEKNNTSSSSIAQTTTKISSPPKPPSAPPAPVRSSPNVPIMTPTSPPEEDQVHLAPTVNTSKRKAHVPSSMHSNGGGSSSGGHHHHPEKRARQDSTSPPKRGRQESASPPEDPKSTEPVVVLAPPPRPPSTTNNNSNGVAAVSTAASSLHHGGVNHSLNQKAISRTGGSTGSSNVSSPCSLSSPSNSPIDWEKKFSEAKTEQDAQKYNELFRKDYQEYMNCYEHLRAVADVFKKFGEELKHAKRSGRDPIKIERKIQESYIRYDKDPAFIKCQRRYAELHPMLRVLKQRINAFEHRHSSQ